MHFFRLREIFKLLTFEKSPISFIPEHPALPVNTMTDITEKPDQLSEKYGTYMTEKSIHYPRNYPRNHPRNPGITTHHSSDNLSENIRGICMYDHAPT